MRALLLAPLLLASLAGCLSETSDVTIDDDPLPLGKVTAFGDTVASMAGGGQGIWIHENILYATSGGALQLFDLHTNERLASVDGIPARDVDVLEWQGRLYALVAGSGAGMHVVDVTIPAEPELVATKDLPSAGVHNLASVPGTPYVYSSGASGATKAIDVVDITDPRNPVVHTFDIPAALGGRPVQSDGCHDITVRVDLSRAYCAGGGGMYARGGGETFIWNITDPVAPQWISMIDDPRIIYHHQAFVNADGTKLIINDEFIAPNCHREQVGPVALQVPFAAAWVYDIADEASPVQRSHVQNPAGPAAGANCGSHFGDMVPGQDVFVMGWYGGGTLMVDFSDAAQPVILDRFSAPGSTWDARYVDGHVVHSGGELVVTALVHDGHGPGHPSGQRVFNGATLVDA